MARKGSLSPTPSPDGEKPEPSKSKNSKDGKTNTDEEDKAKKSFTARLKGLWAKTGLTWVELILMGKGGLPPTIALAIYQATPVAETYTTLGYLVAIISILAFAIMPRMKFIQTLLLNLISLCTGAAVALLMIFCATQARLHTTPDGRSTPSGTTPPSPGATLSTYNSSASAVSGIWLFFQIYLINTIKAKYPQFTFPAIMYSIFTIVSATYAPQFPTMTQGIAFVERLLEAFLTGLAIATGVSFVVFPTTTRKVVFVDFIKYFGALKGALDAYQEWIFAMESEEDLDKIMSIRDKENKTTNTDNKAEAVRKAIAGIFAIHGKLQTDLPFAKREVAFGKLGPDDLKEINRKFRGVTLPIVGLASLINILERIAESRGWDEHSIQDGLSPEEAAYRKRVIADWSANMTQVHEPVAELMDLMKDGLEHVMLRFELKKPEKTRRHVNKGSAADDIEDVAQSVKVGSDGFADYLEQRSLKYHNGKSEALKKWCARKGIELPPDFFEHPSTARFVESETIKNEAMDEHTRRQRQLFALLYLEFLMFHTAQGVLDFVRFADERVKSGKLSKTRLILPGIKRVRKWFFSAFKDDSKTEDTGMRDLAMSSTIVHMGSAYREQKDPEHLPPTTFIEKLGDRVRAIPRFFRSPHSAFGLRVAVATMCIAIINFLEGTQEFFTENRLLWAMIMIAISMTPTAGQSISNFILRAAGTVVAMVASLLVYYIPDGQTAGVLVFFWLYASAGFYIILKKPQLTIMGMISIVTTALIVGYELEVRVIGQAAAESNGQVFLPIYILGPYRLATVAAGLFVAWIWTIFPFPISEHGAIRQELSQVLYLLANFYSIVHETVGSHARDDFGDETDPDSPGAKLEKQRTRVHKKLILLINSLRTHLAFVKWEFPIGGKFPKEQYTEIVDQVDRIMINCSLIGFASSAFSSREGTHSSDDGEVSEHADQWLQDFKRLLVTANITSHSITTLLSLLSGCIRQGHPLPPYLQPPQRYGLSAKLEEMDHDILSVRHINEPGYSAFSVLQLSSRCVVTDLEGLLCQIRELVGEMDFSFHVVSTAVGTPSNGSEETLAKRITRTETKRAMQGKKSKGD